MKRIAPMLALLLCSLILSGQQAAQQEMMEMTGTICNSKCVSQSGDRSVCDTNCKEKDGDAVFVGEDGKVTKIANPEKVKGMMGKHVKTKCKMNKDTGEMWLDYVSIYG